MAAARMTSPPLAPWACELRRKLGRATWIALVLVAVIGFGTAAAQAPQSNEHARPAASGHDAQPAAGEPTGTEAHEGGEHGLSALIWPTVNFLILAGVLYYYLRSPLAEYLGGRSTQVRRDLVDAAELNKTASAQLAEIERKMQALPGELDALKKRGIEEIAAEEDRIASAAAADRARMLTQARREIDVRLQAAQRELSDHAATLALQLATKRLAKDMTPADHARLVDRYVQQVKEG